MGERYCNGGVMLGVRERERESGEHDVDDRVTPTHGSITTCGII